MSYYCKRCRAWVPNGEVPHENFLLSVMKANIKMHIERGDKVTQVELNALEKDDMCYNEPKEQRTASDVF